MSEELLKAIVQLFAIVAKERITDDERTKIKEFLSLHLNQEATYYYMQLFDNFCKEKIRAEIGDMGADEETMEFVGEWGLIMEITRQINKGLTQQQKLVMVEKIIELIYSESELSERQSNLIYYIGEVIKVDQRVIQDIIRFIEMEAPDDFDTSHILVACEKQPDPKLRIKWLQARDLDGFMVFLRIRDEEIYFVKYLGDTELSLNGVPWSGRSIAVFPTGSTVRGEKITPIYYSDVVNKFLVSEAEDKLSFVARDIHFRFKSGDVGIRGVNIAEEGGKLVGIMGASGSGKTTLVNILNGTEEPSEGEVLINGINLHREKEKVAGVIGYVPQDDFLIEELTVYQNLYYAAKLCFDHMDEDELEALVVKTLRNLGLLETRDLRVGSPLDKTISGGQRKRLNIGLELLREPTILFVDEPTSGLSSRDSENIMDLLKELTLRGKMIFVVIHQPSSDIFKMFDTLLILDVGGYPIYYGNPVEAVVYFKDTVNMVFREQGACPECGNVNPEQIFNIIETKVVNEFGRFTDQRKISPKQWHELYREKLFQPRVSDSDQKLKVSLDIPGWIKQLKVFYQRDLLAKLNNAQYVLINMLEAPVLAFFLAVLIRYYDRGATGDYSYYRNDNIVVFFFMSVIVALFMGLTISAEEIIKDRKILKRESFLNLSRSSYLTSKILILFGISAIQTFLFVIIGSIVLEIRGLHLSLWLVLFSTSCSANMMGLNVSSAFKSAITVYILIPLLLIPQLLLSGVVVNFDKFNPRLTNPENVPVMGDLMTSRWAFEALMVNYFVNNKFERNFYKYEKWDSDATYINTYYIPKIEEKLNYLLDCYKGDSLDTEGASDALKLLQNESFRFMKEFGRSKFPEYSKLNAESFNPAIHDSTAQFFVKVKNVYAKRRKGGERDNIVREMGNDVFIKLREEYHNLELADQVRGTLSIQNIVQADNRLIRKYQPIYMDPDPDHYLDYRAPFYAPRKHFAGVTMETIVFNVLAIWFFSFLLYITLYYDILKKVLNFFSRFSKIVNMMPAERRYDK